MEGFVPFARFMSVVLCAISACGLFVTTFILLFNLKPLDGLMPRLAFYLVSGYAGSKLWYWDPAAEEKKRNE